MRNNQVGIMVLHSQYKNTTLCVESNTTFVVLIYLFTGNRFQNVHAHFSISTLKIFKFCKLA